MDRPLVPGVFRSVRLFRVKISTAQLLPVARRPASLPGYDGDTWYDAECLFKEVREKHDLVHHVDQQISFDCTCGFHSFYDLQRAEDLRQVHFALGDRHANYAIGVVENAGRVFHHEIGLRSERMRIVGMTLVGVTMPSSTTRPSDFTSGGWITYCREQRASLRALLAPKFNVFETTGRMLGALPLSPPPEEVQWSPLSRKSAY